MPREPPGTRLLAVCLAAECLAAGLGKSLAAGPESLAVCREILPARVNDQTAGKTLNGTGLESTLVLSW